MSIQQRIDIFSQAHRRSVEIADETVPQDRVPGTLGVVRQSPSLEWAARGSRVTPSLGGEPPCRRRLFRSASSRRPARCRILKGEVTLVDIALSMPLAQLHVKASIRCVLSDLTAHRL